MAVLGEDGRGYELARKLESLGTWRTWLGESCYGNFAPYLNSPTTWEAFMRADESKSKTQIQLQLRVRALLFDKSIASLSLHPKTPSSLSLSRLNPTYLQLHGDDVYFTLENSSSDVTSNTASSMIQSKGAFGVGSRYREPENDNMHQKFRNEVLPETWYNQFFDKYKMTRPYRVSLGDQESDKRSPDSMSTFVRLSEKNKRRRVAFKEDQYTSTSEEEESLFFPEVMFAMNSVPDSALAARNGAEEKPRVKICGILESLPRVTARSFSSIDRYGSNSFSGTEQGANSLHAVNKRSLSHEQATQLSKKVIARTMIGMGFEGTTEVPIEVFSQLMTCHIAEFGRILKVLSDSYRNQCSAAELIKMFLRSTKCDIGSMVEHVKEGSRSSVEQNQQQSHAGIDNTQMTTQAQAALRLQHQMSRQLHPQIQQFVQSQNNLTYQRQQQQQQQQLFQQQQMLQLQRRNPRGPISGGADVAPPAAAAGDKPMVQVKVEQQQGMDANAFNSFNSRYAQLHQIRQQQMGHQFRPMASVQIPTQNAGIAAGSSVRAPPVKVEGFQELMGGDSSSSKHDSDHENRLTSPSAK